MDFDFNLILVPLTLGLGLIWLLDKLAFKQRKTRGRGQESAAIRWAYDFFPVLAAVLIVRSFLLEPFNIPSSSMVPYSALQTKETSTDNRLSERVK